MFNPAEGPKTAVFEHGTMCWGGPERELRAADGIGTPDPDPRQLL